MSAHITQGAYHGTRSKNSAGNGSEGLTLTDPATPTPQGEGGNVPISRSANRPIKLNKLLPALTTTKPSPRSILKKQPSPKKKNVSIKDEEDIYTIPGRSALSSSPTPTIPSKLKASSDIRQTTSMSQEGRPKLKLSFSKINIHKDQNSPVNPSATPSTAATPSLKLKLKQPAPTPDLLPPAAPASAKPKKKKDKVPLSRNGAGSSSKKRKQPDEEGDVSSVDELAREPKKIKKIRFLQKPQDGTPKSATTPHTPLIKLKHKGKVPKRPLGVGYDSELSDRETDPTISEAFMFRMPPGPDCDILRNAVENGLIGVRKADGGVDITMNFNDRHGRRALLNIEGRLYAATVVDLPCIIEGMKSWDKKGWIKSADVSQMFLVLGRIASKEEVENYPLPPEVDPQTFQYAHGVTPPMQWVRKRRFARTKRTSLSAIEAVERKVAQLLADDEEAESVKWDVLDYDTYTREEYERERSLRQSYDESMDGYDEDAEGEEVDEEYFGQQTQGEATADSAEMDDDEVAAELEAHLLASDEEDEDSFAQDSGIAATSTPAAQPHTAHDPETSFAVTASTSASPSAATASATAAPTPAGATTTTSSAEEEDESSDADAEDASGSDDDLNADDEDISDEEEAAARREVREKITELKESIQEEEEKFRIMQNPIIRKKIQIQIGKLRADLEMTKRGAGMIGEEGEDGEGGGDDDDAD